MVTERLRDGIVTGTLAPGTQLSEVELAHSFGVSRGPVREAIQRLVQEGLLRSEPHRGVFVPVLTDADVVDVYLARAALESAALRRFIATPHSQSSYEILDQHVVGMEIGRGAGGLGGRRQVRPGVPRCPGGLHRQPSASSGCSPP